MTCKLIESKTLRIIILTEKCSSNESTAVRERLKERMKALEHQWTRLGTELDENIYLYRTQNTNKCLPIQSLKKIFVVVEQKGRNESRIGFNEEVSIWTILMRRCE